MKFGYRPTTGDKSRGRPVSYPSDTLAAMETKKDETAWDRLAGSQSRQLARTLRVASLPQRSLRLARRGWQRARRGWSADDAGQFDAYVSSVLGGGLLHLAIHADGYPGSGDYVDFDSWTQDLRIRGEALLNWSYLVQRGSHHGRDAEYAAAQDALRWVAEHLRDLWD